MRKILFALILFTQFITAQTAQKNVEISGKVVEKTANKSIEYVIISLFKPGTTTLVTGGTTNNTGDFTIATKAGFFDVVFEFDGFKKIKLANQNYTTDKNIGTIVLEEEVQQIEEVVIRSEKTTVDIKMDKKVYNVGKDIIVRGGTASDVLDNIPSVAVDVEGNVTLRGNENVRVLIDGRPSNAISVADALRLIPAEALDKVEVVTNPSARYEAEGGGGIINIITKKGKTNGLNGTVIGTVGDPRNSGISANINSKTSKHNFFTTLAYNDRNNPGRIKIDTDNFDSNGNFIGRFEERRNPNRFSKGFNGNIGMDLFLTKKATLTYTLNYRKNNGDDLENVVIKNFDANNNFLFSRLRNNISDTRSEGFEWTTNFVQKFNDNGHKLTVDGSFSIGEEDNFSTILGNFIESGAFVSDEKSDRIDRQKRGIIQLDYVNPFKDKYQFEAGFRGSYSNNINDFEVVERITQGAPYTIIPGFANTFEYIENITAVYTQFGTKFFDKFSVLAGLRFENTNLKVNQLATNDFNTRNFNNFFPSLSLTYEFEDKTSISLNYSRRIARARDRFINPFASYTSNVNIFQGNPYLNPSFTNAFDIGYLKKFDKLTLSTSAYANLSTDAFQFVRRERGDLINGIPVVINTAFNLAEDRRYGFEVTSNYNPTKWIRLTYNFNFFYNETIGKSEYINSQNNLIVQDFGFQSTTWTTRLNSKITLPYAIDFQLNGNYNAPQKVAQGKTRGLAAVNLGMSKDFFKEKATFAINVNDLFNTRRRLQDINLQNINSMSDFQFRVRSITASFTYRFNKLKNERDRPTKREDGFEGGGEF